MASKKTIKEHEAMVRKLAKPGKDIVESLKPDQAHLLHMAVGVVGEVGELFESTMIPDRKNQVEEFGDLEFYVSGIHQCVPELDVDEKVDLPDLDASKPPMTSLLITSAQLIDAIKKGAIYQKEFNYVEIHRCLDQIKFDMGSLYGKHQITREEALQANIGKLLKGENARYAEGEYSDEQAQARADKEGEKDE